MLSKLSLSSTFTPQMMGFPLDRSPPTAPKINFGKLARSWHEVEGDSRSMISMLSSGSPLLPSPTPTSNFV